MKQIDSNSSLSYRLFSFLIYILILYKIYETGDTVCWICLFLFVFFLVLNSQSEFNFFFDSSAYGRGQFLGFTSFSLLQDTPS